MFSEGTPSKTTLRIFSAKEMGGTPNSAKGFRAEWFPVKGGRGLPPNSTKENSAKKQVFEVQLYILPISIHF